MRSEPQCPECDYALTGVQGGRCPSCGWVIDPSRMECQDRSQSIRRQISTVLVTLFITSCTIIALYKLLSRSSRLDPSDAMLVLAALLGAAGHGTLLGGMITSGIGTFPLRRGSLSTIVLFLGVLSLVLSLIGASGALSRPGEYQAVLTGSPSFLEASLTAVLFGLPGATLLILRQISIRNRRSTPYDPASDHAAPDPSGATAASLSSRSVPFEIDVLGWYPLDPPKSTGGWTPQDAGPVPSRGPAGGLRIESTSVPRPSTPAIERRIAETWEAESVIASITHVHLHDGPIARLHSFEAREDNLVIVLSTTSYREFLGTNLHHSRTVGDSERAYLANALGTSALLRTSDGYLVLGRRGPRVAHYSGFIHPFGGMVEESDRRRTGTYDAAAAVARELSEEAGVNAGEVNRWSVVGLVRDLSIQQPELLFEAELSIPRSEVARRVRGGDTDGEQSDTVAVQDDPSILTTFLIQTPLLTPVAQASLLIHGHRSWGEAWFTRASELLYGSVPGRPTFVNGKTSGR